MTVAKIIRVVGGTRQPDPPPRRRRVGWATGYLLLLPGALWLLLFFVVPTIQLGATSLYDPNGSLDNGYAMTWSFGNYLDALSTYRLPFLRSLMYASSATILALLLAYPLAYTIAFKAGRFKNLMLVLVIARSSPASWSAPWRGSRSCPTTGSSSTPSRRWACSPRTVGCWRPRSPWSPA